MNPSTKHVGTERTGREDNEIAVWKPVGCTQRYMGIPLFTLAFGRLVLTYFPKLFESQISSFQVESLNELSMPRILVLATWQMTCQ